MCHHSFIWVLLLLSDCLSSSFLCLSWSLSAPAELGSWWLAWTKQGAIRLCAVNVDKAKITLSLLTLSSSLWRCLPWPTCFAWRSCSRSHCRQDRMKKQCDYTGALPFDVIVVSIRVLIETTLCSPLIFLAGWKRQSLLPVWFSGFSCTPGGLIGAR